MTTESALSTSPTHVDDWIDNYSHEENYARFVLFHMRLNAVFQSYFRPWMKQFKLFCTYQGERYRVTGASRMGDVWLARNFERENGYDLRANIDDCLEWGDKP
jgi:hypothetical protein